MGSPHQAFLLARVRPHGTPPRSPGRYRCIGALHIHSDCTDVVPLRAVRRFINLISQKGNASVVRSELRAIDGQYGHAVDELPKIPDFPCPFAHSLFRAAWSTDLGKQKYACIVQLLSASTRCWGDVLNMEGVSIIDITNPETPAYIFMDYPAVVEDAHRYVEGYYKIDRQPDGPDLTSIAEGKEILLEAIDTLRDVPLIASSQLLEAWPFLNSERYGGIVVEHRQTEPVATSTPLDPELSSLVDVTLDIAIEHVVVSEAVEFDFLSRFPGRASQVKAALRSIQPFPVSGLLLLEATLRDLGETDHVDLSGFHISAQQIKQIVDALGNVHSLDVSSNPYLRTAEVVEIVSAVPSLRRLVAMECPSIVDAELRQAVIAHPSCFKALEGILHPAFMTIESPATSPVAFIFRSPSHSSIIQKTPSHGHGPPEERQPDWCIAYTAHAAMTSGLRRPGQEWGSHEVVTVPTLTCTVPTTNEQEMVPVDIAQKEVWTFHCVPPMHWHALGEQGRGWGFVRYTRQDDPTPQPPSERSVAGMFPLSVYKGEVYDLEGYLQCMAREGRPMPTSDAVSTLQDILFAIDPRTGAVFCPMMRDTDIPWVNVGW